MFSYLEIRPRMLHPNWGVRVQRSTLMIKEFILEEDLRSICMTVFPALIIISLVSYGYSLLYLAFAF